MEELNLEQFTGTENWYKHQLSGYTYTDGIKYLAEKAQCYWLLDKILIDIRYKKKLHSEEFLVWNLNVVDNIGTLICDDGNKNVLYKEKIDYTDFPLSNIKFYFSNNVLLLPSEY